MHLKGLCAVYKLSLTSTGVPAATSRLANRLFHVLGKDYFMLHYVAS